MSGKRKSSSIAALLAFPVLSAIGPSAAPPPAVFAAEQEGKMENAPTQTVIGDLPAQQLRRELQENDSGDMRRRRWIIGLAMFGLLNMAYVSLFQTGVIRHLVDPPGAVFNSDRVNSSERAYTYGVPDGTVDLVMLTLVIVLTATGGAGRAQTLWVVPVGLSLFTLAHAGGAVFYFGEMVKLKVACIYCVFTALVHVAIFPLTLPEAWHAISGLVSRR